MDTIIPVGGNVKYRITLDSGVWIFDDRKVDLETYFLDASGKYNELEEYTKSISKHWDREIMEGSIQPPTLKSERKYEKQKILNGTFGIPFGPFLRNASPAEDAEKLLIVYENGETAIPLAKAEELILGFSKSGKPLLEDGPVHVYFGDGSNKEEPITKVKEFRVE
ncbi:peptidyl-prolyl cis-trans isomerase [Mesobacillus zeae]|uniref:Peptidyl-prolyl cis-trans isomerase n=1 Tax=Mesobacillus zeae TaxID=1917180 RepID=A0A398BKG0_9BACI|nr:peptidyl-prolyl cis-trans isomerase [Mesobacillus zeae]RID87863.1 peptidyl-prolyl cis-trans isomerase [Mesobacillus zeae]